MEADLQDSTVFVSYEEVKQSVGPKKVLKVFLVDKAGNKVLAATGEDLGDAHYHYRSSRLFKKYGSLDCHNRKELTIWLEMVISESGGRKDGAHLGADEQNPDGVYFTSHRNERAHYPDGRRCNRWYLIDQHGEAHLAVIGIERDTKDGHYNYNAEEPFAGLAPLHCSNQAGVYKWLEKMITHHAGGGDGPAVSAAHSAASGASGAMSGDASGRKPMVINLSALRSARKSAAALNSLEHAIVVEGIIRQAKPKPPKPSSTPAPLPASTTAKQKSVGIVQQMQIKKARKLQEDIRAEEEKIQTTHLARLRRAAAAEVAGDTAAKATTLGWLHGSLSDEELEHLDHWLALLAAVLDLQQKGETTTEAAGDDKKQQQQPQGQVQEPAAGEKAPGSSGETDVMVWIQQPANRRHHLRVILECLKELGAGDIPARVLLARKVIPLVQHCLSWPHSAVTSMAQHMLDRWSWQLAGHMHVLTCPAYMEDHLGALEEEIMCGMVPLPQLPKHKQALLNTPIPKLPAGPYQTPAPPAKQVSHQQQQLMLQAPTSAPAVMNPAAAAAGTGGIMPYPSLSAAAAGYTAAAGYSAGYTAAMHGGMTPATQTPGFYTPMAAGLPGVKASTGGLKGTGARGLPGLAAAAAAGGAAGRFLYSATPGTVGAAAGRPQGMSIMGGMPAAGPGYVDPAAYANTASTGHMAGWAAAGGGGIYGAGVAGPMQAAGDPAAASAAGATALGAAAGSSTDLAAMAAAAGGAGDPSAAGLYAMQQQQQLRLGVVNAGMMGAMGQQQVPAGAMQVQYAHPVALQAQQPQGVAAAAAMNPQQQQQQQVLAQQWQQQQQLLSWQQQQHMQAVWASQSGGYGAGAVSTGAVSDAAAAASGGQAPQQSGSQGFGQQQQQ